MMEERTAACVATRLTPSGRGAVAVISVEGTDAVEHVGRHFVPAIGKPLASFPLNRIVFGRWEQSDGSGEEIIVCRTSETSLEVNCHGGIAAARAIMNALIDGGAIEQSAEAWAMSHAQDSIEAEARMALAEARTARTAGILLDQFRGALREAITATIGQISRGQTSAARERLARLLRRGEIGRHLTEPWRVGFAGPPNVGKSSLMNCLLGYPRSIVFDQPGTTRDLLIAPTAFEGWPVELTDMAGLRDSDDAIEVEGVSRATRFLDEADLTVLVFDSTCEWSSRQEQLLTKYPNALRVINKCDLQDVSQFDSSFHATSALTGEGVRELMLQINKRLVTCELTPGEAVPFSTRQLSAIENACQAIEDGRISIAISELEELVAIPGANQSSSTTCQ